MPPPAGPHDGLNARIQLLWEHSLSKSTLATYSSALSAFLTFLSLSSLVLPWPQGQLPEVSEDVLIAFVAHCAQVLNLKFETIRLYLSGIKFHYIRSKNIDITANCLQLPYILRAVKKTNTGLPKSLRLPITYSILYDLCMLLKQGMFGSFLDVMFSCTYLTAFYGFLRCGEFTSTSKIGGYVQLSDVSVQPDKSSFSLLLRNSKTDPFGKGVDIRIFNIQPLGPVNVMLDYLCLRRSQGARPDSPLFVNSPFDLTPLTRATFLTNLKTALTRLGYFDTNFNGHSFRIGACTSGAAGGVPDHLLQVLGRWKSSCFNRYIRTQQSSLSSAQALMNSG